jgi:hypothetical protein
MFDPGYAGAATPPPSTPVPGADTFAPHPPPFTDAMFTPKKPGNRKKLLLGGGAAVGVAAIVGVVFALGSGSGGGPGPQPLSAGTTRPASSSVTAAPTVSPSCSAQTGAAAVADWPLNGTPKSCTSGVGQLNLFGGAKYTTSSSHGTVLDLNGSTARATTPLGTLLDTAHSFTVSVWIDVASLPTSTRTVLAFQGRAIDAFELQYDASAGSWAFSRSSVDSSGAQSVAALDPQPALTHAWTHLVGVYDSTHDSITLYVNGGKAATRSGVAGWEATGKITVGASLKPSGKPYQNIAGQISEVEVFTGAFSQPQVDSLK